MDLDADDAVAGQVRSLVDRIDFARVARGLPKPDMFVFTFEVRGSAPVAVPEQELSDDLARLAALVLGRGDDAM